MEATEARAVEIQSYGGESLFRLEPHGQVMNFGMFWGGQCQWVSLTPDQAFGLADQIIKLAKSCSN